MVIYATELEIQLGETLSKNPRSIRYHTARMIAEIMLGRPLNQIEVKKLLTKVANSFPRNKKGPGYILVGEAPSENAKGFLEIFKILERAKILQG